MLQWVIDNIVPGLVLTGILAGISLLARVPQRIGALFHRPRLRLEARSGRERLGVGYVELGDPTPLPVTALHSTSVRDASLAWIVVHNDADRPQADAVDVFARLSFQDGPTRRRLFEFRARWRNSLQGFQTLGDTAGIVDRITVRAGDSEEMDVAIRYDGREDAYGLNTEAHRHASWENAEWRLPPGTYLVKAHVSGRNARAVEAEFDLTVPRTGGVDIVRR